MFTIDDIKNVKKIEITDWSNYIPEKSRNGGHYSFTIAYNKSSDGYFYARHSTSAEFEYCEAGGGFRSCQSCPALYEDEDGELGCDLEKFTPEQILKELNNIIDNENFSWSIE